MALHARELRRTSSVERASTTAFINSLIITIPATIIPVMVAAFAAYAFAWMDFPGRNILFVIVVGLLVVPLQIDAHPGPDSCSATSSRSGSSSPGRSSRSGWPTRGYGLPFAIYLLRNYMGSLPREVFESAAIDGASQSTAFFRLAMPMSVPALASLAIFQFLFVWNDLLVALIYLGAGPAEPAADGRPRQPGRTRSVAAGSYLTAAAFISMILPLLVFFALQRYFVRGITGGAVKG